MRHARREAGLTASSLSDWELWACAQQVVKEHGAKAPVHVADRISELALAGDMAGVATWKAIASRIDQVEDYGGARRKSPH